MWVCPYKKTIQTQIEYNISSKPKTIEKTERFGECEGPRCMAYDGGTCKLMAIGGNQK